MRHYNNTISTASSEKNNNNELRSFEKSVMSNSKESIEGHLSHMKIEESQLNYALFLAIENFKTDEHAESCLLILLRHKANPNCELNSETPLIAACRKGQLLIVKTLLEYGAKPDLCNINGEHPLAVLLKDKKENYDVVQVLVSHMSSVNIEIDGQQPLVIAVERQFFKIFQVLIEKGASVQLENENILHLIAKKKFKKLELKKKFIKELAGRLYLMQEDIYHKLPTDYEESEDIKMYMMEHFKAKVQKQESFMSNKTNKEKEQKEKSKEIDINCKENKENESNGKDGKKKNKDFDISFSEADEEELQEEKIGDLQFEGPKLHEVVEVPEEEDIKDKKDNVVLTKKVVDNSYHFEEFKEEEKEKIKRKLNSLTLGNRKPTELSNADKKKKNKAKMTEDIIPRTLLKRKNSSIEDENNSRHDKNKVGAAKKTNKKESLELQEKTMREKVLQEEKILQEEKAIEARRIALFKEFEELELHLEDDRLSKSEKESETDSEESYQGLSSLNEEIYELVNNLASKHESFRENIERAIKLLENCIKLEIIQERENPRLEIFIYGSQSTGLCIENSDLDLLISTDFDCGYLMKLLENNNSFDVEGILEAKFISGATVPVIKLQLSEKFDGISVDLTFLTRNHMGLKCSETIKAFMLAEPLLRPLVLVIKMLVQIYGLNDPYKGGLGSYAITLMVIALLQFTESDKKRPENVGELLLNFFYFYGEEIDYVSQAIIIHELGLFGDQPVYSIYRLPYFTDFQPKLIIYDPLNPVNNVGRSTFRIASLKKLFSVCYLRLKENSQCKLKDILDGAFSELFTVY